MTGHLATALRRAAQGLRLAADLLDPIAPSTSWQPVERLAPIAPSTSWQPVERLAPEVGWRRHGARFHAPRRSAR